jgi:hypothetical protein
MLNSCLWGGVGDRHNFETDIVPKGEYFYIDVYD